MKKTQEPGNDFIPIQLHIGAFDPLSPDGPPPLTPEWALKQYPHDHPGYYILQFKGPVLPEWKNALIAAGASIFDYIPQFAFIVKMDGEVYEKIRTLSSVRWIGIYQPGYRVAPALMSGAQQKAENFLEIVVSLFQNEDPEPVLAELKKMGVEITAASENKDRIKLTIKSNGIAGIARLNGVKFIETVPAYKLF